MTCLQRAGIGEARALPGHVFAAGSVRIAGFSADGRRRPPRWCRYHGRRLRSAVPAIITPLAADQPSWAPVVHELGAGPTPIPFSTFTAERLATAIRQAVTDQQMRRRAAELGKQIQAEDGPGRTAKLFTQHVARTAAKKAEP